MLLMVGMVLLVLVLIVINHLVRPVRIIHIIDVHIHVDITSHVGMIVDAVVTLHHLGVAHTSPKRHCSYTTHVVLMELLVVLGWWN